MDLDPPVTLVLDRFNALLARDGARLEVESLAADTLTLRYVAAPEGACDACVLDPDDLDVLVADALARQGASVRLAPVLR